MARRRAIPAGTGKRPGGGVSASWLAIGVLAAPLTVLAAAGAVRLGVAGVDFALDVLVFGVGLFLALAGVAVAAFAVVLALRGRLGRRAAGGLVLVAGVTAAAFFIQKPYFTVPGPNDVTSNPADPPAYSRFAQEARRTAQAAPLGTAVGGEACPGAVTVPRQAAVEEAEAALRAAGFRVARRANFRAEGEREGFWFGLAHDAVIRIRPGETDVRVTARSDRAQGDRACRLAVAVAAGLQAR